MWTSIHSAQGGVFYKIRCYKIKNRASRVKIFLKYIKFLIDNRILFKPKLSDSEKGSDFQDDFLA